jgi:hypothetical protein
MPLLKTQDLNTKIITKKPKNARNCESRVRYHSYGLPDVLTDGEIEKPIAGHDAGESVQASTAV